MRPTRALQVREKEVACRPCHRGMLGCKRALLISPLHPSPHAAADPFPPDTVTLDNPAYRWFGLSLMKGKLDW